MNDNVERLVTSNEKDVENSYAFVLMLRQIHLI